MKTLWDAVNELKGDLSDTDPGTMAYDVNLWFNIVSNKYISVIDKPHINPEIYTLVCTVAEFNALVEEMELNFGDCLPFELAIYLLADKTPLEKENKPDYTSLEFWKDAPEGKDYLITYKSGVVANVLNFFKSKPEIIDGYYRIAGKSIGYGQSSWELFKRPQSTPTETPEEKEAIDSAVNKFLVYTQEMADNGVTPSVGMQCQTSVGLVEIMLPFDLTRYTVGKQSGEYRLYGLGELKPIDARTKKEKAIDDISSEILKDGSTFRSVLEAAYDKWVGE